MRGNRIGRISSLDEDDMSEDKLVKRFKLLSSSNTDTTEDTALDTAADTDYPIS